VKRERLSALGAVASAMLASACCIGPLLFAGLGLGAFGLAGAFETYRPYMIGITAIFLGAGFYMTYRGRPVPCKGGSCKMKSASRSNKVTMWVAALMAVASMSYPQWSPVLAESPSPVVTETGHLARLVDLKVSGMTCEGCGITVRSTLLGIPGVQNAHVDWEAGVAALHVTATSPTADSIAARLTRASGFGASVIHSETLP
jgi:mercuric ion transport protein